MTLISHLRNNSSPICKFLRSEFPNTKNFLADARKQVRASTVIRQNENVPWSTIGTALDYRIRFYFSITPTRELAAYCGARILTDKQPTPRSIIDFGFERYDSDLRIFDKASGKLIFIYSGIHDDLRKVAIGPMDDETFFRAQDFVEKIVSGKVHEYADAQLPLKSEFRVFFGSLENQLNLDFLGKTKLHEPEEDELNRHCIALAFMEAVYRGGELPHSPLISPEPHWLDDMRELSWKFYDDHNHLLSLPHTLNPAIEGSYDVGGADADLIVDGALLEIKTTVRPEIDLNWIRQLLGYVLLDYSDSHQINAIGLYMARQGILFQWELEDAIQRLSGDILADIRVLRERFRDLARR